MCFVSCFSLISFDICPPSILFCHGKAASVKEWKLVGNRYEMRKWETEGVVGTVRWMRSISGVSRDIRHRLQRPQPRPNYKQ